MSKAKASSKAISGKRVRWARNEVKQWMDRKGGLMDDKYWVVADHFLAKRYQRALAIIMEHLLTKD